MVFDLVQEKVCQASVNDSKTRLKVKSALCWIRTNDQEINSLLRYRCAKKAKMAHPVGLEPTTYGLEGRCSILLS
jgi:hypothetical protein